MYHKTLVIKGLKPLRKITLTLADLAKSLNPYLTSLRDRKDSMHLNF